MLYNHGIRHHTTFWMHVEVVHDCDVRVYIVECGRLALVAMREDRTKLQAGLIRNGYSIFEFENRCFLFKRIA